MNRKVVSQGPSSMMISLPIKWVKQFGLSKGDEVNVEEKGNNLLVSANKRVKKSKIEIKLESSEGLYIWRLLQSIYINGYDEIKFFYDDSKALEVIQSNVTDYLVGFEVVEQGKNYCVIKAISSEIKEESDFILKRVFQDVLQMSEDFREGFLEKKKPQTIENIEKMNNRHTIYLKRVLVKSKPETPYLYVIISLLQKIANEYKYLLRDFDFKKGFSKTALDFYIKLHGQLESVYDLFFKYDPNKIKKIILEDVHVEEFKILFVKNPAFAYSLMKITDFLRTILFEIINLHYAKKD